MVYYNDQIVTVIVMICLPVSCCHAVFFFLATLASSFCYDFLLCVELKILHYICFFLKNISTEV